MDYVKVATQGEFANATHKVVRLVGRLVGLIKREDGSFFAVEASCKHQGADLLSDYRGGRVATCPRHQWQYDLETGQCLNHDSLPLRRYGVRLDGDDILVTLLPVEDDIGSGDW
jgi:nitrite reductase/ring-hydroxylating ferredoxin subunit